MKRHLFKPELWAGRVRAWAKCPLPCKTEPRHWPVLCILPRDLISHLLFGGLCSASFIYCFREKHWRSRAGVGGQHRDWHMGNSGTELTLHVAGTGRGLKAGTQGIATTWPPPLPWASLCVEQKLCM